jgi:uncharacterized phage infection (PIP) family protein YhgE
MSEQHNPEPETLYGLMSIAEEQQRAVHDLLQGNQALQDELKKLPEQVQRQLTQTVKQAVLSGLPQAQEQEQEQEQMLKDYRQQVTSISASLEQTANRAEQAAKTLQDAEQRWEWKRFGLITLGIVGGLVALILVSFWIAPSYSTIQEMQSTVQQLKQSGGQAEVGSCEGKVCVRVMRNQCYGEQGDWCVLDPK